MIMGLIRLLLTFRWLERWYYLVIVLFVFLIVSIVVVIFNLPLKWLVFKPVLLYVLPSTFSSIALTRILNYVLEHKSGLYTREQKGKLEKILPIVTNISFFSSLILVISNFFKF